MLVNACLDAFDSSSCLGVLEMMGMFDASAILSLDVLGTLPNLGGNLGRPPKTGVRGLCW